MFDFLKGGKIKLSLALDRSSLAYAPGEVLNARISLENDKELKIKGGSFRIRSQERFQYMTRETTTDSQGQTSTNTVTNWRTEDLELFRFEFLPETSLPPGVHTYQTSFTLDPNAPPTCTGSIVSQKWFAKANLDRKLALDTSSEIEFRVLGLTPPVVSAAGEYGQSNQPNEAQLSLALMRKEYPSGSSLSGSLKVLPVKSFDASEVRLELVRYEFVPDVTNSGTNNFSETNLVKIKLAGKTSFESGQSQVFPFNIQVPDQIPPSVQLGVGSLGYKLKGILARTLRSDTRVEEEVILYNGPAV